VRITGRAGPTACVRADGGNGQTGSEFSICCLAAAGDLPSAKLLWGKYRQALVSSIRNPFHMLSNDELEFRAALALIRLLETFRPEKIRKPETWSLNSMIWQPHRR